MKIIVKTLNQKTLEIEINEGQTVRELKTEIMKALGDEYAIERQKLIFSGVIMNDAQQLSTFDIQPDKFVVVMLQREQSTANTERNATSVTTTADANNNSATAAIANEAVRQIASNALLTAGAAPDSNFLTGDSYSQAVNTMVEMGFERAAVEHAMEASFNNPERAFEYLTDGIPDADDNDDEAMATNNPVTNAETIQQVLGLLRQNPNLLTSTLEQMGVRNPELLQQIRNNPDAFFDLMQQELRTNAATAVRDGAAAVAERITDSNVRPQNVITPMGLEQFRNTIDALNSNSNQNPQQQQQQLQQNSNQPAADGGSALIAAMQSGFSADDHAAIDRLKAMGFEEVMAVQAYLAFDKNEALAANFLASNVDDDHF